MGYRGYFLDFDRLKSVVQAPILYFSYKRKRGKLRLVMDKQGTDKPWDQHGRII